MIRIRRILLNLAVGVIFIFSGLRIIAAFSPIQRWIVDGISIGNLVPPILYGFFWSMLGLFAGNLLLNGRGSKRKIGGILIILLSFVELIASLLTVFYLGIFISTVLIGLLAIGWPEIQNFNLNQSFRWKSAIKLNRTKMIATLCVLTVVILWSGLMLSNYSLYRSQLSPEGIKLKEVKVGNEVFTFDPTMIETVRPDLFNPGYFSMFDTLVHLGEQDTIDLEYHFDDSMNTYIIDSINGEPYWWYEVYYDGGWSEKNVFRMDHYPWKNGTTLTFMETTSSQLENIYFEFMEEVRRLEDNDGRVVIPKVMINFGPFTTKEFENVEITPHNMRNEIFRDNVITAIDVIISLGDQGAITYNLTWYDEIGSAGFVRSYWVEAIDEVKAYNRCGFVYEAGSITYKGFSGNHIHLPTDVRILNSPEYVQFFWICL